MEKIKLFGIESEIYVSKHIALVGNSDSLLKKHYGAEIDRYNDVIRFNLADVSKKEYTGTKTTIRWMGGSFILKNAQEHNQAIKNAKDFDDYLHNILTNAKVIVSKKLIVPYDKLKLKKPCHIENMLGFFQHANKFLAELGVKHKFEIKGGETRTGFKAILTCIKSGCIPHLYGFDLEKRNRYKHYSLNASHATVTCYHQEFKEIAILNELKNMGLIKVH